MSQSNCPNRNELANFLRGKVPPQQAQVLKHHVARCPQCAATIRHFLDYAKSQAGAAGVAATAKPRSSKAALFAAIGVATVAILAAGVWVVVRDKDRNEVARIAVPSGGSVEAKSTGSVAFPLPPSQPATKPAPAPTTVVPPAKVAASPVAPTKPPAAPTSTPITFTPPRAVALAPPASTPLAPIAPPMTQPIAATTPAAQKIPAPSDGFVPPAGSQLGLVGRLTTTRGGEHVDAGVLLVYTPGTILSHAVVTEPISPVTEPMIQKKAIGVTLGGLLHVPRDMDVAVWHAGGSSTLGNAYLYVDGREVGVVGDDRTKNINYRVPLTAGEHIVGWQILGGTLGNSLLAFYDPVSGEPLSVYAPPGLLKSQQRLETKRRLDLNAAAPLPKRPPNLLGPALSPSGTAKP